MRDFQHVWSRNLHQVGDHRTFLTTPTVIAQERTSRVVRLDPVTGEAVWEARSANPWGWLAASDTRVFYLNQHERLQCFDLETGTSQWDIILPPDPVTGSDVYGNLVPVGNHLLIGGWRRYTRVHCLNPAGDVVWVYPHLHEYAPPLPGPWGIALPCTRAVLRDVAFLDGETGETQHRIRLPRGVDQNDSGSSVLRYGDTLLAATRPGGIYLVDPVRGEGWEKIAQHDAGIVTIPVTLTGHSVVFLDGAGMIASIDLRRGVTAWSFPAHHASWSPVPAVALPEIGTVVGTTYGRLYLIDQDGNQQAVTTVGRRITSSMGLLDPRTIAFETKGAVIALRVAQL